PRMNRRIFVMDVPQPAAQQPDGGLRPESEIGLHRVLDPVDDLGAATVLPQAAVRLDTRPELWPGEVRIEVETLNLDAASFRQLHGKHDGNGDAVRAEV